MLFVDASSDVVGVGVATPDTTYSLDVAATGVKGIKSAGTVDVTGDITDERTVSKRVFHPFSSSSSFLSLSLFSLREEKSRDRGREGR